MIDVNQLFDIALGLYDFDIVVMVAEKSQKVSFFFLISFFDRVIVMVLNLKIFRVFITILFFTLDFV